jgi:hypothetical protein
MEVRRSAGIRWFPHVEKVSSTLVLDTKGLEQITDGFGDRFCADIALSKFHGFETKKMMVVRQQEFFEELVSEVQDNIPFCVFHCLDPLP